MHSMVGVGTKFQLGGNGLHSRAVVGARKDVSSPASARLLPSTPVSSSEDGWRDQEWGIVIQHDLRRVKNALRIC